MSMVFLKILLLSFAFSFLSFGCANPNTRLLNDKTYPTDWPPIYLIIEDLDFLNGTYLNKGILSYGNARESVFLSEILLGRKNMNNKHTVSLQIVSPPQRLSKILLSFEGENTANKELPYSCAWTNNSLVCSGDQNVLNLAPAGMIASGDTFYIAKGEDGSLIMKIEYQVAGMIVIVPVFGEEGYWARFHPAEIQK